MRKSHIENSYSLIGLLRIRELREKINATKGKARKHVETWHAASLQMRFGTKVRNKAESLI